jgi:predicted ATP-grasp superfamily ATP-dependent carboligase
MAKILVPDYPGQQVVAGIKSLHQHGDVLDLAWNIKPHDYLFKSKYIKKYYKIPAAREGSPDFASGLIEILKDQPYDLILPFGNDANHAVNQAQDEIRKYTRLFTPPKEIHEIAYDKKATVEHCKKNGIDVPVTFFDYAESDLPAIARELKYPAVIKARSGSGVKNGLRYANNPDELLEKYHEISQLIVKNEREGYAEPIIQEFIPGYIHDACVLFDHGKALAVLTQVRHLMYPISGGVGAINITTHDKPLQDTAIHLMESLNWSGPAQVEFKFDERDKTYKLIEINPKLWGTLDLSIQSGVSFPVMIRDFLLGDKITQPTYQAGNCYYFLFPQTSLAALQSLSTFGCKNMKPKNRVIKKFYDVDWGDPMPVIGRFGKTLYNALFGKIANETRNLPKDLINH